MEKLNNRNVVKVSHELNHFRGGYTPLELDFIFAFISCIKNEDREFKEYFVELKDLEFKLQKRLELGRIEAIFDSLTTKSFKVNNEIELAVYPFFQKFSYKKKEKKVSVKFNEDLKPHLLQLKNYSMGNLRYILSFRGEYAKRLYMLLAQWVRAGGTSYTVDELREMLSIPKSYLYGDIKLKVLKKTQKEFKKKAPFSFEFVEKKKGRKVVEITFITKSNNLELNDFKDLIREEYADLRLYTFDNKITLCDKDGVLYWITDNGEKKAHLEGFAEACWKILFKKKDVLEIFKSPSLFENMKD